MDIHSNIKQLSLQKNLPEQIAEQSFELDYLLADYLPDIFKILKCEVTPTVTSVLVGEGKVTCDLSMELRVLYLAEQTHDVCVICQKQEQQKTVDISNLMPDSNVSVSVRPDQCRCRVVNPRRIDLRGTVLLKLEPEGQETVSYLSGEGKDTTMQYKTERMECLAGKKTVCRQMTVVETSPLPYGKPPIETVLLYRTTPMLKEVKRVQDKVVCKGNIRLHLLYLPKAEEGESKQMQTAEFLSPVDAIVNLDAPADAKLQVSFDVITTELTAQNDISEAALEGQYHLNLCVDCYDVGEMAYVSDLYSTASEVEKQTKMLNCLSLQQMVDETCICKNLLTVPGGISQVLDLLCDIRGTSLRTTAEGNAVFTVNLQLDLFALDENGMPFCAERLIPCEFTPDVAVSNGEAVFSPKLGIVSESYRITESGELEVRCELQMRGAFCRKQKITAVTGVTKDDAHPYERGAACVYLYYAKAGEDAWEIAKRFCADHAMMMEENELNASVLSSDRMLLIPSV